MFQSFYIAVVVYICNCYIQTHSSDLCCKSLTRIYSNLSTRKSFKDKKFQVTQDRDDTIHWLNKLLNDKNFHLTSPTLWILEGVLMYLVPPQVEEILTIIRTCISYSKHSYVIADIHTKCGTHGAGGGTRYVFNNGIGIDIYVYISFSQLSILQLPIYVYIFSRRIT